MRVGTVCYATDQGIAHLAKSFFDAGVITDPVIFHHSSRVNHVEWYPPGTMVVARRPFDWPEIRAWADSLDAMLFMETPFDWSILDYAQRKGVRSYVVPMYECCPRHVPVEPDCWLCPSVLDLDIFKARPETRRAEFLPIPVEQPWTQRTRAKRFLHNGGHLGLRGHKGTLELLQALPLIRSPIQLTVRSQDREGLEKLLTATNAVRDPRLTVEFGNLPRERLFDDHDVYVAPEKYNGLSLPLQEARAAGMLVMTSDRYPHNTWLPRAPLIPVASYSRQCISGAFMEFEESRIEPKDIAATIDAWYDADISGNSLLGKEWAEANSWNALRARWMEALSS